MTTGYLERRMAFHPNHAILSQELIREGDEGVIITNNP
jgi:hypothetical protein